uniref:Uncharacterized protein n=1 Tax=Nelumbo nucifera TaxID=4432 RepID=A0A822ZW07_NELNU|nr:TPA_asm: hypothetical protein HUJ06_004338 [Nelumbo nucifera]
MNKQCNYKSIHKGMERRLICNTRSINPYSILSHAFDKSSWMRKSPNPPSFLSH